MSSAVTLWQAADEDNYVTFRVPKADLDSLWFANGETGETFTVAESGSLLHTDRGVYPITGLAQIRLQLETRMAYLRGRADDPRVAGEIAGLQFALFRYDDVRVDGTRTPQLLSETT
jgi:hypothetical protein